MRNQRLFLQIPQFGLFRHTTKQIRKLGPEKQDVAITNVKTVKAALEPGNRLEAEAVLKRMLGSGMCCHKWRIKKILLRIQREEILFYFVSFVLFCFDKFLPEPRAHPLVILDCKRALRIHCLHHCNFPNYLSARVTDAATSWLLHVRAGESEIRSHA